MAVELTAVVDAPNEVRLPLADARKGSAIVSFDRHGHVFVGRATPIYTLSECTKTTYCGPIYYVGAKGRDVGSTPEQGWLTRFAARDQDLWVVYLMQRGSDFRVGWCQLFDCNGTNHMTLRARIECADCVWLLSVHKSKADASLEESMVAARFGLPLVMFVESHPVGSPVPAVYTQTRLDRFFVDFRRLLGVELDDRVSRCLDHYGRDVRYPFARFRRGWARRGRTTNFCIESCNLVPDIMQIAVRVDAGRAATWYPVRVRKATASDLQVAALRASKHGYVIVGGMLAAPAGEVE